VENYVVSKNNNSSLVPSTLGLNENLTHLLKRLYDSELDYNSLKQTMGENSPEVSSIANEIEKIRPAILENVRNQRASLLASKQDISSTNNAYTSLLKTIPRQERELLEISRQQAIKNNVYSFLLQKREETALSSSSSVADNRMIDAAQAFFTPVSPKKSIVYLGAFALALLIGIAIVIAKELLTGKVLFRSQIETYTSLPIVAEITSVKHKSEIIINEPGKAYISEQFRQLRAALGFFKRNATKKKLLITSSIAGEGKSFVAANLAVSLAASGKKVVLIDADIRSPKTTKIFGLEEKQGLAEFLKGELDVSLLAVNSETPYLSIIPAGGPSRMPTELLLNGDLTELFSYLEIHFDYILIDTSPVDPVSDAYVLGEYCDKTLFVIRHGYTPKTLIRMLDENNKLKVLPKLSLIFNGVKKRGFLKGNYGFGYGYGYEYVYKQRESAEITSSLN
jgi:capsular exopolysaccharide synthesis family protein